MLPFLPAIVMGGLAYAGTKAYNKWGKKNQEITSCSDLRPSPEEKQISSDQILVLIRLQQEGA